MKHFKEPKTISIQPKHINIPTNVCDVSKFTFISPDNGRKYGYDSNGTPCLSKPIQNPVNVSYIPPKESPSITYVSPYSSFTPQDSSFIPKHNILSPQGNNINISNKQETSIIGGSLVDQPIQETQIVSVQPQVKEFPKDIPKSGQDWVVFHEQKEHERNIANEIFAEKHRREMKELEPYIKAGLQHQKNMEHKKFLEEVIHPQEDKIEFDKQQLRIDPIKQELDGLKLNQPKHNTPEVEVQYPKITTILNQYKTDYNEFHKQVILDAIPIQALHTLSLRKTDSVDSLVVDLIFDLLKDNHLTSLKTLDLSGNQKSIGASQLNKLADSFFSGNNNLETIDISRAYIPRTELREFISTQPQKLEERLVKDIFSKSEGAALARLMFSVAFCNQPLSLTLESGVLRSDGNPEDALYVPYTLFSSGMNWMGEPDSFKTTGTEMLNHIRQVIETAHQRAEAKQSVSHKPWPESAYKVPHVPDTFTWGITKCLTPKDFSKEGYGELKDKLSEYNPYVRINKVYDIIQFTQTKLDTFVCVTEVMGDRIITHDMLNHQAKWQDAFPIGYLDKNSFLSLGKVNITKQPISEAKTNTQSFDSSCKHCEKSQFDHFLNTQSILQKNDITTMTKLDLSHSDMDDGHAKILAELIRQGNLLNLKGLNVSGNQITSTGYGYLAKILEVVTQDLKIVFEAIKGFSIDILKASMKNMLFIAHNNGISTKEMLTTGETIEHCKNGIVNVGLNVGVGYLKCTSKIVKAYNYQDITIGDVASEILGLYAQPLKGVLNFACITQNTVFSVVDEEFANCLVGVDSLLNE